MLLYFRILYDNAIESVPADLLTGLFDLHMM
jgi:hypothetical protein